MRQSLLYFIAAALFAVATGLNFANEGAGLKTAAGAILFGVMLWMGVKMRKAGG